ATNDPDDDSANEPGHMLPALASMYATLRFHSDRMTELAPQGFALATDVAEWLVRQGVPFRHAHELAGACVRVCEERGIELWDLTASDLFAIDPALTAGVHEVLTVHGALASRDA